MKENLLSFNKARYVEKKMYGLFQICFKKQECCLSPIFYQLDFMKGNIVSIVSVKVDIKLILFLKHLLSG